MPYEQPTSITSMDRSARVFQTCNYIVSLYQEEGGGENLRGKERTDGHLYFAEHPYG